MYRQTPPCSVYYFMMGNVVVKVVYSVADLACKQIFLARIRKVRNSLVSFFSFHARFGNRCCSVVRNASTAGILVCHGANHGC